MISSDPYTSIPVNIYTASLMALIAYGAQGDTVATATSNQGGLFHLTDEPSKHGYRGFVVDARNMKVLEGVWTWDDNGIIIDWSIDQRRHYHWDVWKCNVPVINRLRDREMKKREESDGKGT